jgi:alpha-L-rhamnosidase
LERNLLTQLSKSLMRKLYFILPLFFFTNLLIAQPTATVNPDLLRYMWASSWISCPDVPLHEYGVFHFRKTFDLTEKRASFVVNISADNRYKFYVNGTEICKGPARSDLQNWHFETVDIAPYLKVGKNVLAALVWNQGEHKPFAQHSAMTAFVLQGNDSNIHNPEASGTEGVINTDKTWKVYKNNAYTPYSTDNGAKLWSFVVVGCGDKINGKTHPWAWETEGFDDSKWTSAKELQRPLPVGCGAGTDWHLTPRTIPLFKETEQRFQAIRRFNSDKNLTVDDKILRGSNPVTIPPNSKVKILIDQSFLTVGYPVLKVSKGEGASIQIEYAEALMDKNRMKGNRNDIKDKEIKGYTDLFLPDGGNDRVFTTLWIRTFRYVELEIKTAANPLIINDLYNIVSTYPFEEKASFSSNDAQLSDVWNVGWRTARLCAGETYFDCPYYEQLQYVGDTRIQALISLYVSGDDRLVRKAITDIHHSMTPEGLTQSRYPSYQQQMIPPFSLYWVCMVHDYWSLRKDDAFLKPLLPAVQQVLGWYEKHIDTSKTMLGGMPWWNFVDWAKPWEWDDKISMGGTPEGSRNGNSAILTLQYAYTLKQIAPVLAHFDKTDEAVACFKLAEKLAKSTYKRCFNVDKNEMADTPDKRMYSQHASIMAILSDAIPKEKEQVVLQKILTDASLTQATFYYRFYLTQALKKTGKADLYYQQLAPWKDMLKIGLTTFAEQAEPTRSDCHAWSASPNYDFLATICGIMPSKAGFSGVKIEPALGELNEVKGKMPHPLGMIEVSLQKKNKTGIVGEIVLPKGLKGTFVWHNQNIVLKEGAQKVELD